MYKMDPELVPRFFAHEITIYRRRADGSCKRLSAVNSGRLVAVFDHERIDGADIAWCLRYGNWPKFPLVILDGDPFNLQIENLFPARLKKLRYVQYEDGGKFTHPLSKVVFRNARDCRIDWIEKARDHYTKDLGYVLQLEADERELRKKANAPTPGRLDWEARQRASAAARTARLRKGAETAVPRTKRPPVVPGMVWHYYKKSWISVPPAVHVSDDVRNRCAAWLKGAVRAEYQPEYDETWYFDAAGEVLKQA